MGAYLPLFNIEVEHRFFAAGLAPSLEFVPTPACARLIGNAGLLRRDTNNGLRLFYDGARADRLRLYAGADEPCTLGFKVYARDALFMNYTDPLTYRDEAILYFDNRAAGAVGGRLRLHQAEYVNDRDFQPIDAARVAGLLDKKDFLVRPSFLIDIVLGEGGLGFADADEPVARNYYLSFDARRTFWKYCLMGDAAGKNLFITDLANQVGFEAASEEILPDQRTMTVFRSTSPISLQERFDYRFQLRERGTGAGRVVIKRLPVASANHINREIIDGEERVVSEIYVNC